MRYYGQFRPPVDKILHNRYFPNKTFGLCMECGAADGKRVCSTRFFEETMHWKSINIEAHPKHFKNLVINRPCSLNIYAAMSDRLGTALFKFRPRRGMSACLVPPEEENERHHRYTYVEVPLVTYSSLVEKYNIEHLDIFVLDVEGHELKVLPDLINCPVKPDILVVEDKHIGRDNIEAIIGSHYEFDYKRALNSYYIRKAVLDKYKST